MAKRKSGHATGMAGEFFVMERLFRLGHEPALTLGNAKSIDIIVRTKSGGLKTVSVKAVRGGGKWPVGNDDTSRRPDLIFVLLLYKDFENVTTDPEVWVMPASAVQSRKEPWFEGSAIYYSHKELTPKDLEDYKNAWHHIA
jgi:hypothetical protein